MMLKKLALLAIAGAGTMTAQAAYAQTASASVAVKLSVTAGCRLEMGENTGTLSSTIDFGSVTVFGGGQTSSPGGDTATASVGTGEADDDDTIVVSCSPDAGLTPQVTVSGGAHPGGTTGRQMISDGAGTPFASYTLYSDAAHETEWDAATPQDVTLDAAGRAAVRIEGVVTDLTSIAPGNYSDTVTVTMTL